MKIITGKFIWNWKTSLVALLHKEVIMDLKEHDNLEQAENLVKGLLVGYKINNYID